MESVAGVIASRTPERIKIGCEVQAEGAARSGRSGPCTFWGSVDEFVIIPLVGHGGTMPGFLVLRSSE